ncbi:12916_t:CDS:1, partial [Funneliformis geosporum]
EVKSLQSVINLLAPEYSNRSDSYVKGGPIGASHGEKHGGLEDSGASSLIGTSDTGLDKLLPYILPFSIILFLLIAIMWIIIVKKLRNTREIAEQYIQARDWHLQRPA